MMVVDTLSVHCQCAASALWTRGSVSEYKQAYDYKYDYKYEYDYEYNEIIIFLACILLK